MATELGEVKSAAGGVQGWANATLKNSERDVQRLVKVQKTKLDLPISCLQASGEKVPWISATAWIRYIVKHGLWHRLAGLSDADRHLSPQIWKQFWRQYQILCPHFGLFLEEGVDYGNLAAFYIHGDEGRTLKKNGLMVTTLQSVLGFGFDTKRLKRGNNGDFVLRPNYVGNTLTTRFVCTAIPKVLYESNSNVFHEAMDVLSQDLQQLFHIGVYDEVTKETFRICVIAVKGDWPYLTKLGRFTRSFNTTVKRGTERTKPKGTCHLCLAGQDGFPCEEIKTYKPAWLSTVGVKLPWDVTPSVMKYLFHDLNGPSAFFQPDPWHTFHLGVGKAYVASTVQVCLQFIPEPNLECKWLWLTRHYKAYCKQTHRQPHITKITPVLMSYGDKTGAVGAWSKGALTSNFMRWIPWLLQDLQVDGDRIMEKIFEGARQINSFFSYLFSSPAFLNKDERLYISSLSAGFLGIYADLAQVFFDQGKQHLYPLYPKLHALHHLSIRLRSDACEFGMSMSPLLTACQQDEDVIGRISRLSRRVSARRTMERTLLRYLIHSHDAWLKAGMLSYVP